MALNSGSAAGQDANYSFGWADDLASGDPEHCGCYQDQNNQTTSNTRVVADNTAVRVLDNSGGDSWVANVDAFLTTGIRFNVTTASGSDFLAMMLLLGADRDQVDEDVQISEDVVMVLGKSQEVAETVQISEAAVLTIVAPIILTVDEQVEIGDGQVLSAGSTSLVVGTEVVQIPRDDIRFLQRAELTLVVGTETVQISDVEVLIPINAEAIEEIVQISETIVSSKERLKGKRFRSELSSGGMIEGFVDSGGLQRWRIYYGR